MNVCILLFFSSSDVGMHILRDVTAIAVNQRQLGPVTVGGHVILRNK